MKSCFKCQRTLPSEEFYAHPRMADGRLNKCKDCAKRDSADRIARVRLDPAWIEQERARCRDKAPRYKKRETKAEREERLRRYEERYPEKVAAVRTLQLAVKSGKVSKPGACDHCRTPTESKQLHAHHEDYSDALDVVWLCPACHGFRHRKPVIAMAL